MVEMQLMPVYPITASSGETALDHVDQARALLRAGVRLFQVREKALGDRSYLAQLHRIRLLCDQASAQFIVNDRIDLALASRADGVHLGQWDLPAEIARQLLGKDAIVGVSTHDRTQFLKAQEMDVTYVAIGPIYETRTKESTHDPLGPEFIRRISGLKRLPLVAIGGITLENVKPVWEAGADSVAIISDISQAPDPAMRVSEYLKASGQ